MRIIHILLGRCNPDSANGVDKTIYNLAINQAELGSSVSIFSFTDKKYIPIPSVEIFTSKLIKLGGLGGKLPFLNNKVKSKILEWKPDLIHFHSVHIGPFIDLARLLRRKGIPYVVTPHGGFAPGRIAQITPQALAYFHLFEKSYLEGAKFIHAVSRNDLKGLNTLGVKTQTIVIPNGIDLGTLPTQTDSNLLRRRFPTLKDKRIFLFLGRLDPAQKGIDLLLQAFADLKPKRTALVLVGPDWRGSLSRLQKRAMQLEIADQVIFTGATYGQEKWDYLAGADVFLHPSRWEGFSFSVLEALAMGKPILVSHAADLGDTGTAKTGLVIEPSVPMLTRALREMALACKDDLTQMGTLAKSHTYTKYNWRKITEKIMEAYGHAT